MSATQSDVSSATCAYDFIVVNAQASINAGLMEHRKDVTQPTSNATSSRLTYAPRQGPTDHDTHEERVRRLHERAVLTPSHARAMNGAV